MPAQRNTAEQIFSDGEMSAGNLKSARTPASGSSLFHRRDWLFVTLLVLLAAGFRLWSLDAKPAHFDEGINGWFADGMTGRGYFIYDPTNYHGPWHFYSVWASQTLFGRSLWSLRLPAVLASVAAVLAMLAFSRFLGASAARFAALAMALSPAFVFYGRYSIHESWVVFFNILLLLGFFGLWTGGRKSDIWLCCLGIAGLVLNKETYLIQVGTLLLAWPCLLLWNRVVPGADSPSWKKSALVASDAAAPLAVSIFLILFFYSGTFFYPQGLHGLWQTWAAWIGTGVESGGHEKTKFDLLGGPLNWYWLWLMARYEWPALLGVAACFASLARVPQILRFCAIYAAGLLLAYSLIPYKTPWCIISFLWVFYLVAAGTIAQIQGRWRAALWVLFSVSILWSARTMVRLNFIDFDNEKEPYVYVQTYRDLNQFTDPILEAAARDPRNFHMRGEILLDSYYPLPWTLGDFSSIAYFGGTGWPEKLTGDFVIGDSSRRDEIKEKLDGDYTEFTVRVRDAQEPAVVFFRRETFPDSETARAPVRASRK